MPDKNIKLIAGLGNPGDEYLNTRHNIGFTVIDYLSSFYSIPIKKEKFDTLFGHGIINEIEVLLVKPLLYMNRSGIPLMKFLNYFRIVKQDILVIHDDIDLAFGKIKIKEKGGHGGHKGIISIIDAFGDGDFSRLRIGVGRPIPSIDVSNYVLGRFSNDETKILKDVIKWVKEAVFTVLCKGVKAGMNFFNNKNLLVSN